MHGWRLIAAVCTVATITISAGERSAAAQSAEKGTLGVGLIIGEPIGVSAKVYLSDDTAVDAAVGGALLGGGIHVHASFLWHPWVLENRDNFVLPAYIGAGLRFLHHREGTAGDYHTGLRAVIGMLFDFKTIPLDVFAEVAPILDLVIADDDDHSGIGFAINVGLGVRYYF